MIRHILTKVLHMKFPPNIRIETPRYFSFSTVSTLSSFFTINSSTWQFLEDTMYLMKHIRFSLVDSCLLICLWAVWYIYPYYFMVASHEPRAWFPSDVTQKYMGINFLYRTTFMHNKVWTMFITCRMYCRFKGSKPGKWLKLNGLWNVNFK